MDVIGDRAVLDASADGLGGGAADCVHAVGAVVLLVVQEPAGVGQAAHLDGGVAQPLQLVRHAVHVQQHPGAARATQEEDRAVKTWVQQKHKQRHKQYMGGSSSGGRAGWLITARLLVPVLMCPWARHLILTAPDELAVALHG